MTVIVPKLIIGWIRQNNLILSMKRSPDRCTGWLGAVPSLAKTISKHSRCVIYTENMHRTQRLQTHITQTTRTYMSALKTARQLPVTPTCCPPGKYVTPGSRKPTISLLFPSTGPAASHLK